MKKLLQLTTLFLAPGLMFVFFNAALAGPLVSTGRDGEIAVQTRPGPAVDPAPVGQGVLEDRPAGRSSVTGSSITHTSSAGQSSQDDGPITILTITGLSITHTSPALINIPIIFTASIAGGSPPIDYAWSFGDGTVLPFDAGPVVAHTYDMTGTYTVVVTAQNVVGTVTNTIAVTVDVEAIAGLSIAHTSPALVSVSTDFTASVTGGTLPISFAWSFGDGALLPFDAGPVVSHIYGMMGTYTVVVTAENIAGSVTETILLTVDAEPVTGLSIAHTSPVTFNVPTHFTATVAAGTPPITYAWSFGDGTPSIFDAGPVVSHTYITVGIYLLEVAAFNNVGLPATLSMPLPVVAPPTNTVSVYLPLVLKAPTPSGADLACILSAESSGGTVVVTVEIRNEGTDDADGFWVDLYVDPDPATLPGPNGNLFRWQDACGGPGSCSIGIAWPISQTQLFPGTARILDSTGGYDPVHSSWNGSLPAGPHKIYAYVDSIDNPALENTHGAVRESDETNNRCQKLDLVVSAANSFEIRPRPITFPPRPQLK